MVTEDGGQDDLPADRAPRESWKEEFDGASAAVGTMKEHRGGGQRKQSKAAQVLNLWNAHLYGWKRQLVQTVDCMVPQNCYGQTPCCAEHVKLLCCQDLGQQQSRY